jgi:hypothetical protein
VRNLIVPGQDLRNQFRRFIANRVESDTVLPIFLNSARGNMIFLPKAVGGTPTTLPARIGAHILRIVRRVKIVCPCVLVMPDPISTKTDDLLCLILPADQILSRFLCDVSASKLVVAYPDNSVLTAIEISLLNGIRNINRLQISNRL